MTPARRGSTKPVFVRRLNAAAAPVRFLEYLLDRSQPAAVVDGGGILVRVPSPAQFGVHSFSSLKIVRPHFKPRPPRTSLRPRRSSPRSKSSAPATSRRRGTMQRPAERNGPAPSGEDARFSNAVTPRSFASSSDRCARASFVGHQDSSSGGSRPPLPPAAHDPVARALVERRAGHEGRRRPSAVDDDRAVVGERRLLGIGAVVARDARVAARVRNLRVLDPFVLVGRALEREADPVARSRRCLRGGEHDRLRLHADRAERSGGGLVGRVFERQP